MKEIERSDLSILEIANFFLFYLNNLSISNDKNIEIY